MFSFSFSQEGYVPNKLSSVLPLNSGIDEGRFLIFTLLFEFFYNEHFLKSKQFLNETYYKQTFNSN